MTKFFTYIFLITCLSGTLLNAQQTKKNASNLSFDTSFSNFQRLAEEWANAYNNNDTSALAEFYAPDAEYISSHVRGLVASGRDKVIQNFHNGISSGGSIHKIVVIAVNTSCELTTLLCKYEAINNGVSANGRNLLILKKIGGRWLIITHMTVV